MPRESLESALERLISEERMSRRRFVGRAGSAAFAASALTYLAGCGGAEGQAERQQAGGQQRKEVDHPKTPLREVVFANWPLYIDKAVIKDFKKEFNATLKYSEEINDNTEFFGKVRQPLEQGRSIGRDVVVLTDWMAARWIRLKYNEPLDRDNIPNARNLRESLVNVPFDQGRTHSLPWQSGMTGIGYDKKQVGEIRSIEQLWDPKYKGKVTALTEARDTIGLILLQQGKDPSKATVDDINAAVEFLEQQNNSGQIRKFTGNEYTTDLAKGNVALAIAWSGDMIQLKADNPNLEFVIPEEGGMLWSDNMLIPQKAPSPYGAEVVMNYVYDPEVAAKIAAYVNYVTPVAAAKDVLAKDDPETAGNELIFPDASTLEKLSVFTDLSVEDEQQMNESFQAVVGG
jgi:spermidine/putrescine transport system substrate-binding protein